MGYALAAGVALICLAHQFKKGRKEAAWSPTTLLALGVLISVICALLGRSSWNQVEDALESSIIISLGVASFAVAGAASAKTFGGTHANMQTNDEEKRCIESCSWKYWMLSIIVLIAIIVRVSETYEIGLSLGISTKENYFTIAEVVRGMTASFAQTGAERVSYSFSFLVNQFDKAVTAIGFVSAYLLAKSLVRREALARIAVVAVPLILSCAYYLSSNSRSGLFWFTVCFLASFGIHNSRSKRNCHAKNNKIRILFIFLAVVAAIIVFYALGCLYNRGSNTSLLDYVSFYFGCGTPSLQVLLDEGVPSSGIIGGYTFNTLFSFIAKFVAIDTLPGYSIEWIDLGGNLSNIFTAFARYYIDFGYLGVVALSALSGFVLTKLYRFAVEGKEACSLLYCSITPFIFDMARDEYFFSRMLSPNQIILLMMAVIFLYFLQKPVLRTVKKCIARSNANG